MIATIIPSGGENISSIEVETALHQHEAVLHVAVVAVEDEFWGEVPVAVVETKPGVEVRLWCILLVIARKDSISIWTETLSRRRRPRTSVVTMYMSMLEPAAED